MKLSLLVGAVLGMTQAATALPTAAPSEVTAEGKRAWLGVYGGQGKNAYDRAVHDDDSKEKRAWLGVYGGQGKNAYDRAVHDDEESNEKRAWLGVYGGQGKNAYDRAVHGEEAK